MRSFLLVGLLLAWSVGMSQERDLDELFSSDVLVIVGSDHACHRLDIYLAVTREQQLRGLMFVRRLPETTGMLFIYPRPSQLSIWMRNTYIPLDVAFFDSRGGFVNMFENARPRDETSMPSSAPAQFVLEVNGGVGSRIGLGDGARLLLGLLENSSD